MESIKRVGMRGLRGFVAGSVASMSTLIVSIGDRNVADLKDLKIWMGVMAVSGIVGGISGAIMALDKYYRDNIR